jgi:putative mycofactocin binding protein MftB
MTAAERKLEGTGRYKLAPGAQVREEKFGLLFYHRAGPRLYFLNCGALLGERFFAGEITLEKWMCRYSAGGTASPSQILRLEKNLNELKKKGVILEC